MCHNVIFAFLSKKITHDLAATSNTAKLFLMKKQKNSVVLNLKIIPFDQKKLNKMSVLFPFLVKYIFQIYQLFDWWVVGSGDGAV